MSATARYIQVEGLFAGENLGKRRDGIPRLAPLSTSCDARNRRLLTYMQARQRSSRTLPRALHEAIVHVRQRLTGLPRGRHCPAGYYAPTALRHGSLQQC